MHAQASLPAAFFDALLPAAEALPAARPRKSPAAYELPPAQAGEAPPSMARLHERLSLLAQLELPCTILVASPPVHLRGALIETVELDGDESLTVGGGGFSLRLRGPHIHSVRLAGGRDGGGAASLDILYSNGMLYASIRPEPDGPGRDVWRDVMDNPSLPLA